MTHKLIEFIKKVILGWDRFFFMPVSEIQVACFRIVFGAVALALYSLRAMNWRFFFTDQGIVPGKDALELVFEFMRPTFSWFPISDAGVLLGQAALIVAIFMLMIGIFSRMAALIAFVLHVAFLHRNYLIGYGADFVATFMFFSLIFIESDRCLSLRRRLFRVPPMVNSSLSHLCSSVGVRILQIQMCLIYGYTGLEKVKGPSWWDGTAVWAVFGNPQLFLFDLSWLKNFPLVIAGLTFLTVLFEVYFPVLVWFRQTRGWLLLLGIFLHAGIAGTIGLVFFSAVMVSSYVLFVDSTWLETNLKRFTRA